MHRTVIFKVSIKIRLETYLAFFVFNTNPKIMLFYSTERKIVSSEQKIFESIKS